MFKKFWQKLKSIFTQQEPVVEVKPVQEVPVRHSNPDTERMVKWAVFSYHLREEALERKKQEDEFRDSVEQWRENIRNIDAIRRRIAQ
ncbi:hypothetical protein_gp136 [Bacillus phage vB_BceM_WH1]|nr:hypothetical protein_gp136 [Bacillus phage vB_BceM_WH1]